ncbi:hypothetical protein EV359DRAFT_68666 [Lentinula novae-zelandiae]|nr:hypothetical protein EV359DRAFT_68666 [Lentinula novae-zelandiae]
MSFQSTVASNNRPRILTHYRSALLTDATHSLSELPFFNSDFSLNQDLDIAQGLYQVPIPAYHPSSPASSNSNSGSEYYFSQPSTHPEMPSVFSSVLDETITYAKWKPCGNDPRVSNWIKQNREEFTNLSFKEFFGIVHDRVLDPDWQNSTFRKMHTVRMPDDLKTSISDLAVQLLVLNNLLQGTPRFQSEDSLKMMLIDAANTGLREAYNKEVDNHAGNPLHGIHAKDFHMFTHEFQVLDHGRHRQLLIACQMAEHMIRSCPNSHAATPLAPSTVANTQECLFTPSYNE